MTLNGAIMQLVELRESSMMPEALKPCFDKVIETISECEEPPAQPEHDENELNFMQPHKRIPVQLVVSSDCISRQDAIECLERLSACDEPFVEIGTDDETFIGKYEAITEISVLPPAQPYTEAEIQKMQDLYQAEIDKAFELGQEDARSDIIHCGECKHRDPEDHKCDCGHDILWQLPREDEWYCADAERKG